MVQDTEYKKVQVGNDQEEIAIAKTEVGKLYLYLKTYRKPSEQLFPNMRSLSYPNLNKNMKTHIRLKQQKKKKKKKKKKKTVPYSSFHGVKHKTLTKPLCCHIAIVLPSDYVIWRHVVVFTLLVSMTMIVRVFQAQQSLACETCVSYMRIGKYAF